MTITLWFKKCVQTLLKCILKNFLLTVEWQSTFQYSFKVIINDGHFIFKAKHTMINLNNT